MCLAAIDLAVATGDKPLTSFYNVNVRVCIIREILELRK